MLKFLIIGDSHVPNRASNISEKIQLKLNELTKLELWECTFFTGDEINFPEFIEFLNKITKNEIFRVIGNMDYYGGNRDAPMYQKLEVYFSDNEKVTIGLTHGHQISPRGDRKKLELLAIEKNYNILISGHTHKEEIFLTNKGILLLNPGSVTGAWSFVASGTPSFIILSIDENTKKIGVSLFQLKKNLGVINKTRFYYIFRDNVIYKN